MNLRSVLMVFPIFFTLVGHSYCAALPQPVGELIPSKMSGEQLLKHPDYQNPEICEKLAYRDPPEQYAQFVLACTLLKIDRHCNIRDKKKLVGLKLLQDSASSGCVPALKVMALSYDFSGKKKRIHRSVCGNESHRRWVVASCFWLRSRLSLPRS